MCMADDDPSGSNIDRNQAASVKASPVTLGTRDAQYLRLRHTDTLYCARLFGHAYPRRVAYTSLPKSSVQTRTADSCLP